MSKHVKLQIRTALRAIATLGILGFIAYFSYPFTSKSGYGHFAPRITDKEIEGNSIAFAVLACFLLALGIVAIVFTYMYMTDRFIYYCDTNHLTTMGAIVAFALSVASFYAIHICDPLPHNMATFFGGLLAFAAFGVTGFILGAIPMANTQNYLDGKID